jgi:hypothetical protein
VGLEDAEDLATSDALDERDTVLVTEQDADLRRHLTLLRSLGNHLVHLQAKSTSTSTNLTKDPTQCKRKRRPRESRRKYSHRRRLS